MLFEERLDQYHSIKDLHYKLLFINIMMLIIHNRWFYCFCDKCQRSELNHNRGQRLPSRQILVPRTSWGRPPPASRGRPLKILFDRPGDVSIWRPRDVPIRRPGNVLKWRRGDVLMWRSRDVPRRLIWDVPSTFSGRPLEDLQSTQTWMSKFF